MVRGRWLWLLMMPWTAAMADDVTMAARLEHALATLRSVRADFTQELHRAEAGPIQRARACTSGRRAHRPGHRRPCRRRRHNRGRDLEFRPLIRSG